MNVGGWIFMSVALISVWSLAVFCYRLILRPEDPRSRD